MGLRPRAARPPVSVRGRAEGGGDAQELRSWRVGLRGTAQAKAGDAAGGAQAKGGAAIGESEAMRREVSRGNRGP
jgi:hypothetical protein